MNPDSNHFLFIAHPGHELCVHAWLASTRPTVFVLTDGSGHGAQPRISSTTRLLRDAGAVPGSIYARFTDAELYALILEHDFDPLLRVTREFAEAIVAQRIAAVAGDAMEGYNPAHDVCRLIINSAVRIARRRSGRQIVNRDFLLVGPHVATRNGGGVSLQLDDAAFEQKLRAARAFPELQPELQALLSGELLALQNYPQPGLRLLLDRNTIGSEAYRVETLRQIDNGDCGTEFLEAPPFYESYGELRVADGYYSRVIRYREHLQPLAEALSKNEVD